MPYLPYLFMVLYGLTYLVGMTLAILGILALLKYLRNPS